MTIPFWRAESFSPHAESARGWDPRNPARQTSPDSDPIRPALHKPRIALYQQGSRLIFTDPAEENHREDLPRAVPGSPMAMIASTDGRIGLGTDPDTSRSTERAQNKDQTPILDSDITEIRVAETGNEGYCRIPAGGGFFIGTDREHRLFRRLIKPEWADAIGRDRFGLWATIALNAQSEDTAIEKTVIQRLRWISPGRFIMGSPASERAGFPKYEQDNWCVKEAPRHEVILTRGYWLFDTPCTQALWQAVMGKNPSRFQSPDRPVESVTWHEAGSFMDRLNARLPGLALTLPTEAQWEYACRAGTETATYGGVLELEGSNNAPVLDPIAWYGGNSGVEFELEAGCESSNWREKQYEHVRAGTHPVARKQANPWGLHDMLGNVWEWCRDGLREYGDEIVIDPAGPEKQGEERVVRGGSWYYFARYVRAAFRLRYLPGVRFDRLGFRCAANPASATLD
ncbi:MAG: Formylglycine-generating enzyme, required for sulfatase activity, contains SUMF1/FGE domain [Candidatus Kentron sp. G]|nr:MAG: Formylglycine-generating enzyme, required for sulfatase activity, contains SUMF1/FGE domain [Candidatus Kentron sp. G]VFN00247.1 MAG: Formylglycine-generating enzyme, required for sulfatase activity, contains SUMF1/FGE domain [Candidatus Kentron sp. G]